MNSEPTTTLIVSAMAEELAVLRARLVGAAPITIPGGAVNAVTGRLGGQQVVLAATGDGARNAQRGIAALLDAVAARELLVLGISGGLSPELREGDLIVGSRVLDELVSGEAAVAPAGIVGSAARASGARPGTVVTARHIADSVAEKRRLAALAGTAPSVVDLESAAYVAAACRAGLPWLVVRAVSDTADEALPALLNRARDEGGAVRRASVVRGLFGDPGALPALISLRRRLKLCGEALARAATAIITGGVLPAARGVPPEAAATAEPSPSLQVQAGEARLPTATGPRPAGDPPLSGSPLSPGAL